MIYPRALAVRVLTQVLSEHHSLDEVLARESGALDAEVVGWLYEICAGTLRWKGRLDWVLDSLASHKKPTGWLRKILLLATYQLIAQDRAPAALVVSETVDEVKKKEGEAPARFANACLRKIASQAQEWRNWKFPESSDPAQAAAWAGLPLWMWNKLVHQRGLEWAQKFSQATLDRPRVWIRSRSSEWRGQGLESGLLPTSWVYPSASGGGITQQPGFAEGQWIVQDISSQILIHQVTQEISKTLDSDRSLSSLTALDLCAAPGGKSVGLAWSGFQVTSTEIRPDRVPILKETLTRAAPGVEYLPWDTGASDRQWDLVWVDAPCSGSGIIRRHPDVRWLRAEKEIAALTAEQSKILHSAWERVKPGGFLAYSVCSVFADEGERRISEFLKDKSVEPSTPPTLMGSWLLSPQDGAFGDGFWGALIKK